MQCSKYHKIFKLLDPNPWMLMELELNRHNTRSWLLKKIFFLFFSLCEVPSHFHFPSSISSLCGTVNYGSWLITLMGPNFFLRMEKCLKWGRIKKPSIKIAILKGTTQQASIENAILKDAWNDDRDVKLHFYRMCLRRT